MIIRYNYKTILIRYNYKTMVIRYNYKTMILSLMQCKSYTINTIS